MREPLVARPRQFDEEDVLDGAVAMFRVRGYGGTNIPDLTGKLGICRRSLYATFGDKRGLYLRALEAWGRRDVEPKLAVLRFEGSPLGNVRTLIRSLAVLATECPGDGSLTVTAMVEGRHDPEVQEVAAAQVAQLEAGLAEALDRARTCGELAEGVSPTGLARMLTTTMCGMGLLARSPGSGARIADTVGMLLEFLDRATGPDRGGQHPTTAPTRRFEPGI